MDVSTMEANAALRTIVRRNSGEGYREMLARMAKESGIETPTAEELIRLDRARKGKKLSNAKWGSPTDPDARIAKMKDGRTHLAYKPEHAMDLDTGTAVAAEVHAADRGGMRRAWLRGRANMQKRYLIHVAGHNLGSIMRLLTRAGTPRELQTPAAAWLCVVIAPNEAPIMLFVVATNDQIAVLAVTLQIDPFGETATSSTA